jgi:Protein of unknown function (DUF3553)
MCARPSGASSNTREKWRAKNFPPEELKIRYKPVPPEPPRPDGLAVGAKITHPTFGFGHITNLDKEKVTIMFDKSGSKKIAADYIKLA